MSTSRDRLDSTLSFLFLKVKFANSCSLHSSGETEAAVHENNLFSPKTGQNVTTECHLFLYRKLPFSPLLFFSFPTKQPAHRGILIRKSLSPAYQLGATLHRRSIYLHVSSEEHSVQGLLTSVASRRGFLLMVESRSNAGVRMLTVLENQIVRAHHLGCVKRW